MSTVTVTRKDLTTAEVVTVLRDGLGAGYNVLPGMVIGQLPFRGMRQGRPVTITPRDGQTRLRIRPGGVTLTLIINTFGIAHEIRKVLADSPSLSGR
ncbi:MAG: hypothetical protein ACRDNO_31310 [Trebonia sp.]